MANFYKKTKFFLNDLFLILSLSKPLSRVIVFCSGLIILWLLPTNNLHYLPVRSIYESLFNFKPYSSGITRAVSRLLHADIKGAWNFNPLVYFVIPIVLFILIKDILYLIRTRDFSV